MEPSGRLHHASSETTLIIARRSRSELIAPFIPFSKSPLCACTSFAILPKRASHRRGGGCVLATYPFTEVERAPECDSLLKSVSNASRTRSLFFDSVVWSVVLPAVPSSPPARTRHSKNRIVPTPRTPFFPRLVGLFCS